ncbi:MAG: DNA-processing protein DprA [Paracoccaceae bacterium]
MAGELDPSSTHPPLPPTTEDIRYTHLRLLRSRRVGRTTYHRLLAEYGTAQNALAALPEVAQAAGVSGYKTCPEAVVLKELRDGARIGAKLLIHGHDTYPSSLMDMTDAPPALWTLGNTDLLAQPMIAMVGARNASALGSRMAKSLAQDLGTQGFVIVSGLARGIDAAAHLAALPTGTIAVQAGGVDVMYPAENTELAEQIAQNGLRISEQPIGLQPQARHFPIRNRIIAGLASGCVVVEAAAKSGSLITAREAADLGRDVMAVPGHPFDARASGCNILIRDGATLVRRAEDVVDVIGPLAAPSLNAPQPVQLDLLSPPPPETTIEKRGEGSDPLTLHTQILGRLGPTPMPEDQLLRDLNLNPETFGPALTDLEISGDIHRHAGGFISRPN